MENLNPQQLDQLAENLANIKLEMYTTLSIVIQFVVVLLLFLLSRKLSKNNIFQADFKLFTMAWGCNAVYIALSALSHFLIFNSLKNQTLGVFHLPSDDTILTSNVIIDYCQKTKIIDVLSDIMDLTQMILFISLLATTVVDFKHKNLFLGRGVYLLISIAFISSFISYRYPELLLYNVGLFQFNILMLPKVLLDMLALFGIAFFMKRHVEQYTSKRLYLFYGFIAYSIIQLLFIFNLKELGFLEPIGFFAGTISKILIIYGLILILIEERSYVREEYQKTVIKINKSITELGSTIQIFQRSKSSPEKVVNLLGEIKQIKREVKNSIEKGVINHPYIPQSYPISDIISKAKEIYDHANKYSIENPCENLKFKLSVYSEFKISENNSDTIADAIGDILVYSSESLSGYDNGLISVKIINRSIEIIHNGQMIESVLLKKILDPSELIDHKIAGANKIISQFGSFAIYSPLSEQTGTKFVITFKEID